ncbi:WAT1-related At5g07050 [Olea europaea subsp. europaea]|uniref:WAT1-related At5g07050 n=1 Tax=Olea europaea subsp. europaea TaxID=158383 RepID=A0A8S0SAH7_OLEEU|nr:WAT1-related At5g07050 [Olea europaea subsp. europaea]
MRILIHFFFPFLWMNSVIGSIIIVIGLYSVLWGKYKEEKENKKLNEIPEVIKDNNIHTQGNGNIKVETAGNSEPNGDADFDKCPSLAINLPLHQTKSDTDTK